MDFWKWMLGSIQLNPDELIYPFLWAPAEWLDGNIQYCVRFCLFTLLCSFMPVYFILASPFLWRSLDFRRKVVNLHTVSVTSCLWAEIAKGTMLTQHKPQQLLFLTTFKMSGCALPNGRSWSTSSQSSGFLFLIVGCDAICSDKHINTEVKLTLVYFALFQPLSTDYQYQSLINYWYLFRTEPVCFLLL